MLGALAPFTVLLVEIVAADYRVARESAAKEVQAVARGIAVAVEQELRATISSLEALAGSSSLASDDLVTFRTEAEAVARRHFPGASVALLDLDGQQAFNTFAPPGKPLPRRPNLEAIERVKATSQPAVSDVFLASLQMRPIVPVDVPVFGADGAVRAILSLAPPLESFAELIARQRPENGWIVGIFDSKGTVVARTPFPERYVGRPALPGMMGKLASHREGTADLTTQDGTATLTAWVSPGPSGWTVAVGIPRAQFYARPRRVAVTVLGAAILTLAGALALAGVMARRIARPVQALTQFAEQRFGGEAVAAPFLGLHEADRVAAALLAATRERQSAERRVQQIETEGRFELECRVAERTHELQAAQAQLIKSQRLEVVGQLTAGVAHDFNNLLQAMMAGLELLLEEVKGQEHATQYAELVLAASERGARLTHSLLSFSRQQVLRPTSIQLPDALDQLQRLLATMLDPRITLQIEIGATVGRPLADVGQLEAALLNLCLNGSDAMAGCGRRLSIEAYNGADDKNPPAGLDAAGCIVLAVTDEGCGMDETMLARACEPFFTTKGIGDGSGLGLPMVQGFAQQSGGELRIQSAPGIGTRVELWLPLATAGAADTAVPAARDDAADHHPSRCSGRILLVDDDPSVLGLLSEALQEGGFDVTRAASGIEALAILQGRELIDILVTDYAMPAMTGGELVAHARALRPGLPALVITGYADQAHLGHMPESTEVLHKPFRSEELLRRVAGLTTPAEAVLVAS